MTKEQTVGDDITEKIPKNAWIIHPFLFAVFHILNLYTENVGIVIPGIMLRPVFILVLITWLLYYLLKFLIGDKYRRAVIVSLLIIFTFSVSFFYKLISRLLPVKAGLVVILWVISFLLLILGVLKLKKPQIVHVLLNSIAVSIFIFQCITLAYLEISLNSYKVAANPLDRAVTGEVKTGSLPDIYYIILDGYGREDILNRFFGFDNSRFTGYLEKKGFFVARQSHSNYSQTYLSLASSLNGNYIDRLVERIDIRSKNRRPLIRLIRKGAVARFLKKAGYSIVTYKSGYTGIQLIHADVRKNRWPFFSEFESIILKSTLFSRFFSSMLYRSHRSRIGYTFDSITGLEEVKTPKFVFAHFFIPHPPFVFDRDGGISPSYPFNLGDGLSFYQFDTYQNYIGGYRGQVQFTNRRLRQMIDGIISDSTIPPVIVLQGDHGPGSMYHPENIRKTNIRERFSIFYAVFLPEEYRGLLFHDISPVNTFRVIFNTVFQTGLRKLENKSYYSNWTTPYKFTDVSGFLKKKEISPESVQGGHR